MTGEGDRRHVWLPLLAYFVLVGALVLTHDVWRDEVRAFSVATYSTSWLNMLENLHIEGHPALWYVILRAGYAITHSRLVLPVSAFLAAVGAAWVVLRFAPFNLISRLLIVFGVFLSYEASVVARNYGIGVLLLVTACAMFSRRASHPWALAGVLVLLANTSVHAAAAAAVILFLWLVIEPESGGRARIILPAIAIVAGIAVALSMATPSPDLAFAKPMMPVSFGSVLSAVLIDPGKGLSGFAAANITASSELPWARLGIDRAVMGRILTNVALLSVAWSLRRNRACLAALVLAIIGFEVVFHFVYQGSLRHMTIVAFVIVAICWIAIVTANPGNRAGERKAISLGLFPLLAIQTAALPFTVVRHVTKPESMAPALAAVIRSNPKYAEAVLMSEPGPFMETLKYYVPNRVYFPRQREFGYRAYFYNDEKQKREMTVDELLEIAEGVACSSRQPVLLSIGHRLFLTEDSGWARGPFGTTFSWTPAGKAKFEARVRPLDWFPGGTSDENYRTFEVLPSC